MEKIHISEKTKFEVVLSVTQHSYATVVIEAKSLAEAERKAEEIAAEDIDDWKIWDGELWVDSVTPLNKPPKRD